MRILLVTLAFVAIQAQAPPDTEVFLAPLSRAGGKLAVGAPVNISSSPGYDNQPSFLPDGSAILFTSARSRVVSAPVEGVPAPAAQMDIYRYDLGSKRVTQVTDTLLSEYSPTVTPDGRHISVIRVEEDGTQRLWRFTIDGKQPSVILAGVKPVGYHAWLDEHRVALFILGERPKPATLQVADTRTGKADVVAEDIGQSIQRMPGGGISFVHREPGAAGTPGSFVIKQLRIGPAPDGRPYVVETLVPAISGASAPHVAWTPDGTMLTAHGGKLHAWQRGSSDWTVVADLDAAGLRNVTRLALSPKGDSIALVAARAER
jgi:hypothetical protein